VVGAARGHPKGRGGKGSWCTTLLSSFFSASGRNTSFYQSPPPPPPPPPPSSLSSKHKPKQTLCIVKPDAVTGGLTERILTAAEQSGFYIVRQAEKRLTPARAREFYRHLEVGAVCTG
jgi:hypothetical protein